jgi:hypothetical protein
MPRKFAGNTWNAREWDTPSTLIFRSSRRLHALPYSFQPFRRSPRTQALERVSCGVNLVSRWSQFDNSRGELLVLVVKHIAYY